MFDSFPLVWSDDDWLKKFSGKTLEENKEEEGSEPPKAETQEVRLKAHAFRGEAGTYHRRIFKLLWKFANIYAKAKRIKNELSTLVKTLLSELKRGFRPLILVLCVISFSAPLRYYFMIGSCQEGSLR